MDIAKFIKEDLLSIVCNLIVLIFLNIYFISLNSIRNNLGDLIYLDLIVMIIYIVIFVIKYVKWKGRYEELYNYMIKNRSINEDDIKVEYISEEIMKYIIKEKEDSHNSIVKDYEEKLNTLEEYITKWIHEIKIPISALNIINERMDEDDISIFIKNELGKINFLVNSVLYGSRATVASEDIFIKEENLSNIVKASIKNNAFFLIKNNIEVDIHNLDYNIYTDKKWVMYILDQIINNSIKYLNRNGKIKFYGIDEEKYVTLCIRDNGIGIVKEDIERIFNKGFTGSNGRNKINKSTGMGLYFSSKILEKLGHGICVESVEGEYTLIKINFYKISDYLKVTKM